MNDIMTIGEVAAKLQVGRQNVYKWVRKGLLAAIKLPGGDYRVTQEELSAFIERCREESSNDPTIAYVGGETVSISTGPMEKLAGPDPFQRGKRSARSRNDGETNG